jgi:genome maintenance exonuclease 1
MIVNKFNYIKLSRATINGKRLYSCPDGSKLPSVTTILSATSPQSKKDGLNNWRKRVGVKNATEITSAAANRGSRMHSFIEGYIKNGEISESGTNPFSIESHKMAKHIIKNGFANITEYYGSEISLYYPELYAGSTDLVALKNGELILGDYKQTNKPKRREWIDDYFLQLSAYICNHNLLYDTDVKHGIIMMCDPTLYYQEFDLTGDELEHYKEEWWKRVYQYYDSML